MEKRWPIPMVRGAGGGGKGGGGQQGSAKEDKDTLFSTAYGRVIDVLCEGPIEGFTNPSFPLRCIKLDDTPIENDDGRTGTGTFTLGSPTLTVAAGTFNANDIWKFIGGPFIPSNTQIWQVSADGSSATMTKNANGSGSNSWELGGSLNFNNFTYYFVPGNQSQGFLAGFDAAESVNQEGIRVKKSSGPWTRNITDPTIDAVRIDISFPRLQYQDPSTGDVHGIGTDGKKNPTLEIEIRLQSGGSGDYVVMQHDAIRGKASGGYVRSYKVEFAGHDPPWSVQVARITADSDKQNLQNETWVSSYTTIIYGKLSHPNTALVGAIFDASHFSSIPRRGYDIKGVRVKIPTNYDPIARTYATTGAGTTNGTWDGSFKTAWTDNPAWCWYAMATNARWGLGHLVTPSDVDKFLLYAIAKYCDEMVPTGYGGPNEARFTCNLHIQEANDAYKVLSDMMGICRGMVAFYNGMLNPIQDSPVDPSAYRMFSPANVLGGVFNYAGVGMKARHNAVKVSWQDYSDNGNTKFEYVEDPPAIVQQNGINLLEITGFGCWSRGQARRWALGALYMEKLLTDTVSFQTALEGYFIKPGQIIQIQDPFRAGQTLSGRFAATTNSQLTLDRPVTLLAGHTYTIGIIQPSTGKVVNATVLNGAGTTSLILVAPLSEIPDVESIYQLAANDLSPELFRVLSFTSRDKNTADVVALQHDESIYDFIDFNEPLDPPVITLLPNAGGVLPPGPLQGEEVMRIDPIHGTTRSLELAWGQSRDPFLARYRVTFTINNGPLHSLQDTLSNQIAIPNAAIGTYAVTVVAINTVGLKSTPVSATFIITDINPLSTPSVTGLELWGQGNNTIFTQRDAKFVWRLNSPTWFVDVGTGALQGGAKHPVFSAFDVSIFNGTKKIWHELVSSTEYVFTLEKNREAMRLAYGADTPALNRFRIEVRILDTYHALIGLASLTVANPPPNMVTVPSVWGTLTGVSLSWVPPNVIDYDHAEIFVSANPSDPAPAFCGHAAAPTTSVAINLLTGDNNPTTGIRYFWIHAVDTFGNHSQSAFAGGIVPGYAVAPVSISPNGGNIGGATTVTLACVTPNAEILYKLGSAPYVKYTGPFSVSTTVKILAYARLVPTPLIHSVVSSAQFTFTTTGVATPSFSPAGGSYGTSLSTYPVTINCSTPSCTIRYTTDGTAPNPAGGGSTISVTAGSTVYNVPVGTTKQIRAIATRAGWTNSAEASAIYSITAQAAGTVATPTFAPAAGAYLSTDYPKTITITSTSGSQIRYTLDGTTPAFGANPHGTLINSGGTAVIPTGGATLKAKAIKSGMNDSAVATGVFAVGTPCAQPSFAPAAGAYPSFPQSVAITSSTSGAQIKYTLDGTDPNTSGTAVTIANGASVSVAQGKTLKAIAFKSGLVNSTVRSGTYTLAATVATPTFAPAAGLYNASDYPKQITISSTTAGSTIAYTTDGSTPTPTHGAQFATGGKATVTAGQTLKAMAFKSGLVNSGVASGTYTAPAGCATPVFSPDGTTVIGTHTITVSISTTTPSAQMRYTTNGTTPSQTNGTLISGSSGLISLTVPTAGVFLQAIAFKSGLSDSLVYGAQYDYDTGT